MTISFTAFANELEKEAGLRDFAKKLPAVAKKLPAQGKQIMDRANLAAAKVSTKYPRIYRELNDPSNFAGLPTALKRLLGG